MNWKGAAALCIQNERLLMVYQGKKDEEKLWSIPSGGLEPNESIGECCKREVWEETGYEVEVGKQVYTKWGSGGEISIEVLYFETSVISGAATIQDPDGLIHGIEWVSLEELRSLPLAFPEDIGMLESYMKKKVTKHTTE
ncbi:NUDIX domain-containing protein [Bacillus sp. Marseille-Q1617]|uniref:NUDIX domain-containing protein n=1 Tax=Bacillus sp. Marseille-Q1617 TaxID=2736887 RepID=UPI0026DD1D01|nr:NUDIX hydrolase [Bacillus sp. Marseille-Q1617]